MRNLIKVVGLSFTMFLLLFSFAAADSVTYTFQDDMINWPGYTNPNGDTIGNPQVEDMRVTITDGMLERVEIDITNRLTWDALFINTNYNGGNYEDWDYYVLDYGNEGYLYSVVNDYEYTYAGHGGRTGHPNGIDEEYLTLISLFTVSYIDNVLVYDFSDSGIQIANHGFYIGYTPWCANDVTGGGNNPVPEPATLILTGMGLLGLYRTRRNKKA